MTDTVIIKVQVPMATNMSTNDPDNGALAYTKGRETMAVLELTPELLAKMDGKHKKFFYTRPGEWTLLDEAPWQAW